MMIAWLIFEIILILFSCITLSYVAMAASVGPWISPAIIIASNILITKTNIFSIKKNYFSLLNQASCNLAGLVCTAIGFTLPTLFFLDRELFRNFLSNPLYFCAIISGLVIVGSMLGTASISCFGKDFLGNLRNSPVSNLIVQAHEKSSKTNPETAIFSGIALTGVICLLRDGLKFGSKILLTPTKMLLFPIRPTMVAVGYTIGSRVITPLIIGVLCNGLLIKPLANYTNAGIFSFTMSTDQSSLTAAFCSGMILYEAILSLISWIYKFDFYSFFTTLNKANRSIFSKVMTLAKSRILPATIVSIVTLIIIGFSPIQAIFVSIGSIIASVEISRFVLGYGLAPFGRFASFLMFPAIAIFPLGGLQTTLLCVFVSIACAAAANLTIQNGVAKITQIDSKELKMHHWLGIFVCALSVGIIFWVLCTNLNLGTSELFAQRGRMRAILINTPSFNRWFMLLGGLFGFIMQRLKLQITMVFGGLMMPKDLTFGLICGAILRKFFDKKESVENFWTGAFIGESLIITLTLIIRLFGNFLGL